MKIYYKASKEYETDEEFVKSLGTLYEVDIPELDDVTDWEDPKVRKLIASYGAKSCEISKATHFTFFLTSKELDEIYEFTVRITGSK